MQASTNNTPVDLDRAAGAFAFACKPPLIIYYLYYTKIGLGILLGLDALLVIFYIWRGFSIPSWVLKSNILAPFVAHLVSFLGWAVREIGRKPWTIYGVMTVDVAHTMNPPTVGTVVLVIIFFLALGAGLLYAVWRFIWKPGGE